MSPNDRASESSGPSGNLMPRTGPNMTHTTTVKPIGKAMSFTLDRTLMDNEANNRQNGILIRKPSGFRSNVVSSAAITTPATRNQDAGYPFSSA